MTFLAITLATLAFCSVARAEDLSHTLGLDRRVPFITRGPELTPFSYVQPIETIAIPNKLMIPLQAVNESLAFYAAYRDRNYPAMAAVSAMFLWGGTLRRGIDAVAGSSDGVSLEVLETLSDREIAILGYLWHTEGRTGSDLYRDMGEGGTWKDLSSELKAMEKRKLIRKDRARVQDLFHAEAAPADVRRAAITSGNPGRITSAFSAIKVQEPDSLSEASRESIPTGHRVETQ
jgi:hypothetical protein